MSTIIIPYVSGDTAFRNSNYTDYGSPANVTLGNGWTSVGVNAFYYASNLTSITLPETVTKFDHNAFYAANNLTAITIPSGVTSINNNALYATTRLTSITIPSAVTSIGTSAFAYSGLTQATINTARLGLANFPTALGPNQTIGGKSGVTILALPYQFSGSGELTQAIVTNANLASNNISNVVISGYGGIGLEAFRNASSLTSITITSGVTRIENGAFQSATSLTSITIPSTVTRIGIYAFFGASSLTSITIPANVTSIGNSAFLGASSLIAVIFETGSKLTSIGNGMFEQSAVKSITIPVGVTSIGDQVFQNVPALTSITIPSGVISIGAYAFRGTGLTSITIPSTVTSIGNYAFLSARALTSITIPSGVTSIKDGVFYGATNLTSITIPASVTSIGSNAFRSATSLTSITIPSTVTSIDSTAFLSSGLTTALFESASTVNALGLQSGNLINGYTVSSFYGMSSITIRYTEAALAAIAAAIAAKAAAPAAVISNGTFTSLLTSLAVNISNITSEIITLTNDPYVDYSAKLTIPNGNLSTLSDINKSKIINNVKALYAAQLGVNVNKIIVTLQSGSIIVNVNVLNAGITEAMVPICFPKGTPVTTNQGVIAIEKLNPDIHTIRGKKIVAITQSRPLHKYIISIETDALGKNVPSAPIQISKEHKVFYKGKMVKANELVEVCEGVTRIPYSGETLYNVLMEKHDNMMINNVICETLDPKNIMAKICGGKYNRSEQDKICKELNDIIKTDNIPAYKKLYASLK